MSSKLITRCQLTIIGGGISGLSLAYGFLNRGFKSFLLLEQDISSFGGYASLGWMKISLLPAGQKTANYLKNDLYKKYAFKFLNHFSPYLIELDKSLLSIDFNSYGFHNKYYKSFLLPKLHFKTFIDSLISKLFNKILIGKISLLEPGYGSYEILLDSGQRIITNKVIIASGRSKDVQQLLIKIGEKFNVSDPILFGCRACFKSDSGKPLFNYQIDFRIKNNNCFETYCFNYKGKLLKLKHSGNYYFSGFFDPTFHVGNSFLGKKININVKDALKLSAIDKDISFNNINKVISDNKMMVFNSYIKELRDFVKSLIDVFGLNFICFCFPAIEQFWPKPILRKGSLESKNLKNIFYIGEASGIAFGVLQSYVTSMALIEEIL